MNLEKKSKKELIDLLTKAIETITETIELGNDLENPDAFNVGRMQGNLKWFLKHDLKEV